MDKFQRYREKNMHPCAGCGARVLRTSVLCKSCDRKRRIVEMSESPVRLRHGYARAGQVKPEHYIWASMIQRCTNPKARQYADYGGRGIQVCERWSGERGFDNFLADMGPRPEGKHPSGRALYTIERTNNDGNYSPENCVWATYKQQAQNRSEARMVAFRGETLPLATWVDQLGLDYKIVHQRLARGWSVEQAFAGSR